MGIEFCAILKGTMGSGIIKGNLGGKYGEKKL